MASGALQEGTYTVLVAERKSSRGLGERLPGTGAFLWHEFVTRYGEVEIGATAAGPAVAFPCTAVAYRDPVRGSARFKVARLRCKMAQR